MGYRQVLSATNDAAARKNIAAWTNLKSMLDTFISKVVTWEQDKPDGELTIKHVVKVMNRHKVMEEGLTALGMDIEFYYEFIELHPAQAEYLVRQNLA